MNSSSSDPSALILARSLVSVARSISSRPAQSSSSNGTDLETNPTSATSSNATASLFIQALPVTTSSVPALQATCLALLLLAGLLVGVDLLWGILRLASHFWSCEGGKSKYNQRSVWSAWRPLYAILSLAALGCNSAAILERLIFSDTGERNAQVFETAAFGMGALSLLFLIALTAPTRDKRNTRLLVRLNHILLILALVCAAAGSSALLVLTSLQGFRSWIGLQASLSDLSRASSSDKYGGACSPTDQSCGTDALADRLQALANAIEKVDYVKGGVLGVLMLLLLLINVRAQRSCTLSARTAAEEARRLVMQQSESRRGSAFSFAGPSDEKCQMYRGMGGGSFRLAPPCDDRFTQPVRMGTARLAGSRRTRRASELVRSDSTSLFGSMEKTHGEFEVPGGFKQDWVSEGRTDSGQHMRYDERMDRARSWDAQELRPGDLTSLSSHSNHATLDFGAGLGITASCPTAGLRNPHGEDAFLGHVGDLKRRGSGLSTGTTTNGIKLDMGDPFGAELARLFGSAQETAADREGGSARGTYRNHHHLVQEKSSRVNRQSSSMRMSRQNTLRSTRSDRTSSSCASLGTVMSDVPLLPAWEANGLYVSHVHPAALSNAGAGAALASSKHIARRRRLRLDLVLGVTVLAALSILQFLKFAAGDDLALGLKPSLQLVEQCSTAVIFALAHAIAMVALIARRSGSANLSIRDDDDEVARLSQA